MQRTSEVLHASLPALKEAGAGPVGVFGSVIAQESPFIFVVTSFPSAAAMEGADEKLTANESFRAAMKKYASNPAPGYKRLEACMLRAFDGMPQIVPPPAKEGHSHVFELRMYESNSGATLARKIKMFNDGEIGIFKRLGMQPVFYGQTVFGPRMPNLVYMLTFDDLAARERLWRAFGADPEWQKLRSQPGNSDAEIVSNISNSILHPLPFSEIR